MCHEIGMRSAVFQSVHAHIFVQQTNKTNQRNPHTIIYMSRNYKILQAGHFKGL